MIHAVNGYLCSPRQTKYPHNVSFERSVVRDVGIYLLRDECHQLVPGNIRFGIEVEIKHTQNSREFHRIYLHQAPVFLARVQVATTQPTPLPTNPNVSLHHPFVPNLLVVSLSPDTDLKFRIVRKSNWNLW